VVQVVLTGGCINTPGFVSRFQTELRALVPSDLELVVTAPVVSHPQLLYFVAVCLLGWGCISGTDAMLAHIAFAWTVHFL
jgi:actin-related protein